MQPCPQRLVLVGGIGVKSSPWETNEGLSHVNDATAVLFPRPPLATIREYGLEFLLVTIAVLVILYIPLIWIGLALGAKRRHDRDKSAWWLLVFYALPTILSTAADRMEDV
jgi:uncharacterized membrane protein YhaH (DUF805 family)